jgi:hypothetical protein
MYYLTRDMAQALSVKRPYANLQQYADYKKKGIDAIRAHEKQIAELTAEEPAGADEETTDSEE